MDAVEEAAGAAEVLTDPDAERRAVRAETPPGPLPEGPSPLDPVIASLTRRGEWETACDLVGAVLSRACAGDGTGLYEAFWAAERLCEEFRSAPARLLPALSAVLAWRGTGHPWVSRLPGNAADLLGRAGQTDAADVLADAAGDPALRETADHALTALIRLGDGRSVILLAKDLPGRPRALRAAVEHGLPFDPGLLSALRERLRELPAGGPDLFELLRSWGSDAHEAVPELCAALPEAARPAADALAAVARSTPELPQAETALRQFVSDGDVRERMAAARALWRLTGDAEPVLAEVAAAFATGERPLRHDAAEACRELGEAARPLLPVLHALLTRVKPRRLPWQIDVAVAVWRLTGEAEHVLPALDAALATPASVTKAILAAGELGPAARPLAERIAHHLYDLDELPTTIRTLLRVCPDGGLPPGCSPPRLLDLLLTHAREARNAAPAFEVIAEVGTRHLTGAHLEHLRACATGERRVSRKHSPPDIAADGALGIAARTLLESVSRASG
ncbi:hypothetical protein ABGB12_04910 [Actinocorallia sp. B10E7]|uniref:hypothetical protein n=1 Tax=Actinocorallia sp. B10E7 TaxID=3153558 RepID=UPI00325E2F21